jgi:hypothetical protein
MHFKWGLKIGQVQDWFTCNSQLELLKCSLALFCPTPLYFLLQQISKRGCLLIIGSYELSVIIGQAKVRPQLRH